MLVKNILPVFTFLVAATATTCTNTSTGKQGTLMCCTSSAPGKYKQNQCSPFLGVGAICINVTPQVNVLCCSQQGSQNGNGILDCV